MAKLTTLHPRGVKKVISASIRSLVVPDPKGPVGLEGSKLKSAARLKVMYTPPSDYLPNRSHFLPRKQFLERDGEFLVFFALFKFQRVSQNVLRPFEGGVHFTHLVVV